MLQCKPQSISAQVCIERGPGVLLQQRMVCLVDPDSGVQALLAGKVPPHNRDLDKTRQQTLDAAGPDRCDLDFTSQTLQEPMMLEA